MRFLPAKLITVAKITGVSVVLATTLGQAAQFTQHPAPRAANPGIAIAGPAVARFKISGHVGGLYPGKKATLRLKLTNPNRFPIVVRSVSVKVRSAGGGCKANALHVAPFHGSRRIKAHRSVKVALRISLRRSATTACAGARFPLKYSGKASRA